MAARGRGFTLLEMLLAMGLMIVLLTGVYAFYFTLLRTRDEGGRIARESMLNRALLEEIADHIRHATDMVPGDGIGFRGKSNEITIVRTRVPEPYAFNEVDLLREKPPPAQKDLIRIWYGLTWDTEGLEDDEGVAVCYGLGRTIRKHFDPNPRFVVRQDRNSNMGTDLDPGGDGEEDGGGPLNVVRDEFDLVAPEIKYLRFQYFDGAEWRDQWQMVDEDGAGVDMGQAAATGRETYALPQAVRLTLGRERIPPEDWDEYVKIEEANETGEEAYHPDRYTLIVHLPQADPSLISSRKYGVADQLGRQQGEGVPR